MHLQVHLLSQSNPIDYPEVINAYTKDGMYCVQILRTFKLTTPPSIEKKRNSS